MKAWRGALPFLLMVIAAAIIVWLSMRDRGEEAAAAPNAEARTPRYVTEAATWTRFDIAGQPQMRAQAARIDYYEDRSMEMQTVVLDRIGGEQGHWHLTAAQGRVPAGEERIRLTPQVLITGAPRADLPTEVSASEVWVDWNKRQITSERPVRARAPGRELQGNSWTSDFDATRAQVKGNVQVEYDVPNR